MSLRKLGADDDDATSFGNDDQSYGGAAEAACAQVGTRVSMLHDALCIVIPFH